MTTDNPDPHDGPTLDLRPASMLPPEDHSDCAECDAIEAEPGPPAEMIAALVTEALDPSTPRTRLSRGDVGAWIAGLPAHGEADTMTALPEQLGEHAQPLPTPSSPAIVDLVLARILSAKARGVIQARDKIGVSRYGTRLRPHNGRDVQRDFTDEVADAVNYAMQGLVEAEDDAARAAWEHRFAMAVAMLEEAVGEAPRRAGGLVLAGDEIDALASLDRALSREAYDGSISDEMRPLLALIPRLLNRPEPAAEPAQPLIPGSTWTGPDGTVYDVVRPEDVGDRPRWGLTECMARICVGGGPPSAPLLGLPADADDEAVRAAVEGLRSEHDRWRGLALATEKYEREHHEAQASFIAEESAHLETLATLAETRSKLAAADRACEASGTALRNLSAAYDSLRDRVVTVADEAFGPFPVQTAEEALTAIEGGVTALRQRFNAEEAAHLETLSKMSDLASANAAVARDLADIIDDHDESDASAMPMARKLLRIQRLVMEGARAKETADRQRKAQARRVVKTTKGAKTIDADAVAGALRALAKAGTKSATAAEICEQIGCYRSARGWSRRAMRGYSLVGQMLQKLKRDGKVTLRGKRWALTRSGR